MLRFVPSLWAAALVSLALLVLAGAAAAQEPAADGASLGKVPGNLVHYDAKGKRFLLSDWVRIDGELAPLERDQGPAILVFGAHWCGPCKDVVKALAEAREALDKAGVHRLYVHVDDLDRSEGTSLKELRKIGSEMAAKPDYQGIRVLLGGDMQEVQTWMADPGHAELPGIVVVSRDGEVLARPGLAGLSDVIEALTAAPAN